MHVLTGGLFFALAAYIGVAAAGPLSARLVAEDDIRTFAPPVALLVAGGAVLGAVIVSRAGSPGQVLLFWSACVALAAIVVVDARFGIIPDVCTIVPLAVVLLLALWQRDWWVVISAFVPFVPFAIAALLSNGYGMGWGDVKLAALGGALLGAQLSTVALGMACIAAVFVTHAVFKTRRPVPLGPYMAGAIALALPLGMTP